MSMIPHFIAMHTTFKNDFLLMSFHRCRFNAVSSMDMKSFPFEYVEAVKFTVIDARFETIYSYERNSWNMLMKALNPAFWCNHCVDGANEHLKFLNVFAIKIVIFCAAFRDNANAALHANFLVFGSPIYTLRSGEVDIKEWKCHGTALVWQTTRLSEEATAVMNSVSFFSFSVVFVILSLNPVSCQYEYNMGQS